MTSDLVQPLPLAQALIRRPSITPTDAGALDVLGDALERLGFKTRRMPFEEVDNLYARYGTEGPVFLFAGHTDVVPPGTESDWTHPPFDAHLDEDGVLWGRGASDMKGALASMVAACAQAIEAGEVKGSIAFLITGDEEGPALNGTKKVAEALHEDG